MTKEAFREYLQKLGRQGGLKRAKNMTKAQRIAAARKAAKARWAHREERIPT